MNNNKLWVFQSKRTITVKEEEEILEKIHYFLKSWAAHGAELKSEINILDHKFLIISVDEAQTKASGCSIDSLNQCIREIDAQYHLELLNRLWISYKENNKDIETIALKDFKEKVKAGLLSPDTWVYNLSVSSSEEFNEKFKQPLYKSWAKIYL
ncbi:hypothetical protein [Apibacter adventoris]|uniref:hypothetical protein n=1 Tax=Apibacter adventoris TaxID=1679466 RepID=UPI000CF674EC|nr:hypothetical protein [Apibacter adventoris]PQL95892.1 hypothetical protein C4S76_01645 [Apibacter adventoris]